ncbi:MAG TPA: plastocyanin/azurin family copper-binding protein [Solirubrobacteraceae bacterium]|nr:plastocyanin/azurin family copper-binding protein [Solirubrobacteraceae bacterium]
MPPPRTRIRLLAAATCALSIATALCAGAGIGLAAGRGTGAGLAGGSRTQSAGANAGANANANANAGKHHCRRGPTGRAHRARVIWTPAFPRPDGLGLVARAASGGQRGGHAAGSRGCRTGRRRPAAKHGVSTTTPTSGPPGAGGSPGSGGNPGETGAPGGTTPPGEGGSGETPAPPSVPHVQVTAVEYHFTLSRTTVPAGKVVFNFVNSGQDEHNLNVLSGEGSLSAQFANTESKGVRNQTVEMRHGTFTLFCSLPEHESKGMKATLTVE